MTEPAPGPRVFQIIDHPELTSVRELDQDSIGIFVFKREVECIHNFLRYNDREIISLHAKYKRPERETGLERPVNHVTEILVENFPVVDGMTQAEVDHLKAVVEDALRKAYPTATITFLEGQAPEEGI